jgi:Carboxypeptidase regulatory-like domain
MKARLRPKFALLVLATIFCTRQWAEAQLIRGFISGTITDSSNAVIPGVQVSITNTGTNISRETTTNEIGFYRFVAVEPGNYSVEFKAPGFENRRVPSLTVSTAAEVVINQTLAVGVASTELVVVATPGTELEKTNATIERTLSDRVVSELPLQVYNLGRDISRLALLAPTVNRASGSNEFAGNGQRARNNNFMIDGVDNNDLSVTISAARTIPEAVQEVQIQTTAYSAEFGRNTGVQFSAITKSGTNSYHGELWDYHRGNWMEPISLTDKRAGLKATPRFVLNQFGGDAGGPIFKDRTFFFGLLEVDLRREAPKAANATPIVIPTPAGFAALSSVPLGPNQTATSRQAMLSALSFLPGRYSQIANFDNRKTTTVNGVPIEIGNALIPLPRPYDTYYNVGRIDHRLTDRDNLSYRYHLDKRTQPDATGNLAFGRLFSADQLILRQNHAGSYTRTLTPRLLNEARFGYVRSSLDFPERDPKSPFVSISGLFNFGGSNGLPQSRLEQLYQLQDVATYLRGRNSFKFGAELRRDELSRARFVPNSKGMFSFTSLQEYLNNNAATIIRAYLQAPPEGLRATEWGQAFFFQDDVKVARNLTLNLGLRYERTTMPLGFLGTTDPAVRAIGVPGPAKNDNNNWAPRIGFGYSPTSSSGMLGKLLGDGKTSLRGGFGVAYDVLFYNLLLSTFQSYPYVNNVTVTGAATLNAFPNLPPNTIDPNRIPTLTFINVPSDIQNPTMNFWSLSLQRELGSDYVLELGYTGNRSYHMLRQSQTNPGILTAAQAVQVIATGNPNVAIQRLNPAWGPRPILESGAKGEYHAGYVKFDKRMSKGLLVGANYTWSVNMSDADETQTVLDSTTGAGLTPSTPQIPEDFFNFRKEWSRSAFDRPHRFVVHYVYEIPWFSSSSAALRHVFGGWQISGFTEAQSGQPFTITTGVDTAGVLGLASPTFPARPNYNPNGVITKDPVTGDFRTFSTPINGTGIVVTPLGTDGRPLANSMPGGGNLGRNTFRGPSFQNWNFSVMKKITFKEDWQLQLRSDFFNVWNHNNFANPVANMSSPAFGNNISTGFWTDARLITLSAKIRF